MFCSGKLRQICLLIILDSDQIIRHYINTTNLHMMYMFLLESVYHEYKEIWDAAVNGVGLPCEREPVNPHNNFAVAVQKPSLTGNMNVRLDAHLQ